MGFSRQEYWSEFPIPSSGDLPDPGIKRGFPTLEVVLYHLSHQGSPFISLSISKFKDIQGKVRVPKRPDLSVQMAQGRKTLSYSLGWVKSLEEKSACPCEWK